MPLGLELPDDDQWQDQLVLGESSHRAGVGQQHRRVQDEGAAPAALASGSFTRARPGPVE
jgi:hypothetical protein